MSVDPPKISHQVGADIRIVYSKIWSIKVSILGDVDQIEYIQKRTFDLLRHMSFIKEIKLYVLTRKSTLLILIV